MQRTTKTFSRMEELMGKAKFYALAKRFVKHGTFIMGKAGRGKTDMSIRVAAALYGFGNVVVVCPTNKLADHHRKEYSEFGVVAMTWHKFFGQGYDDDGQFYSTPYDMEAEGKSCVIFDEIMMYSYWMLVKVWSYMQQQQQKQQQDTGSKRHSVTMIAAGDPCQLSAMNDPQLQGLNELKLEFVYKMFPNVIQLFVNHRIQDPNDRAIMEALEEALDKCEGGPEEWREILLKFLPSSQILSSYQEILDKGIKRGLSYRNDGASLLNRMMNQAHVDEQQQQSSTSGVEPKASHTIQQATSSGMRGLTYFVGDEVNCTQKGRLAGWKADMQKNYTYRITQINEAAGCFIVVDEDEGLDFEVPFPYFATHFVTANASTVHSSQGSAITEPFVIIDWMFYYVDKQWLYTALSRASKISDIYVLDGHVNLQKEPENFTAFIHAKLRGYIAQDKLAQRLPKDWQPTPSVWEEMVEWFTKAYKACNRLCPRSGCGQFMSMDKNDRHQVTINRLFDGRSGVSHCPGNRELVCKACNVGHKD